MEDRRVAGRNGALNPTSALAFRYPYIACLSCLFILKLPRFPPPTSHPPSPAPSIILLPFYLPIRVSVRLSVVGECLPVIELMMSRAGLSPEAKCRRTMSDGKSRRTQTRLLQTFFKLSAKNTLHLQC